MSRNLFLVSILFLASLASAPANAERATTLFNADWRFSKGDPADAASVDFDDSEWSVVRTPHDWAIAGPFDPRIGGSTGMLPWRGVGWYRKTFTLPPDQEGKRVILLFDGVMADPQVHLNGRLVGGWTYGYNSFWLDVTSQAHFDQPNVVAVRADTQRHGSRWYPGAGIYRKVTMLLLDPVHVPVWGSYVTTPLVSPDLAKVQVDTLVANKSAGDQSVEVEVSIADADGRVVARAKSPLSLAADSESTAPLTLDIESPHRWDVDDPYLYTATTRILVGDRCVDGCETKFGVRTFQWTANDGFHLNGRRLQLRGVNLHHDNGPLGAVSLRAAEARKLRLMKDMGVNAVRTSHNPASPELLDLCDELGMVVFNELFDKYGSTAGVQCSTAEFVEKHAEREVRNFVRRDRNHPCVVVWSIGNEIPDILANRDGRAAEHVAAMVGYFRKYDPTRPTTMGCHMPGGADAKSHILDALDTSGWNYGSRYDTARRNYPDKPLIYSESASAFSARGAYALPLPKSKTDWGRDGLISSHDYTAASWADIPELEFERMRKDRFVAGEFVWTGFDYLGEPTPFSGNYRRDDGAEARSSFFGIVDLAGLPKDRFYLYRSYWNEREPTVHLLPHWNWEGHDGAIPVFVYTNGDRAELFLNGKSLGMRSKAAPDHVARNNLAHGKPARASSEELKQDAGGNVISTNLAGEACDGVGETRWCAESEALPQWWSVDLENAAAVGQVSIEWERAANSYDFVLEGSQDLSQWTTLGDQREADHGGNRSTLIFDAPRDVRYLRITVTRTRGNTWASIRDVHVLPPGESGATEDSYYAPLDAYRLRWMNVPYEPGELKAVAYQDGEVIGETRVRTAGPPAALRLIPDRDVVNADGDDLCYVTVEMVDDDGTPCPNAMEMIEFEVDGPADLVAVGNGDAFGRDAFTDNRHPLFHGRAVAVLRTVAGRSGPIRLTAKCDDPEVEGDLVLRAD